MLCLCFTLCYIFDAVAATGPRATSNHTRTHETRLRKGLNLCVPDRRRPRGAFGENFEFTIFVLAIIIYYYTGLSYNMYIWLG